SWRTCPNVNERRNVPNVEGATSPDGRAHARSRRSATHRHRRSSRRQPAPKRRASTASGPASPPRPLTQIEHLVDQLLDPEPPRERADQDQPRVGDRALVIKRERQPLQPPSGTPTKPPPSRHHTDDLLTAG